MTRVVNAPSRLVFDAWTNPEHVPHWMLGPEGWSMPVCEIDLRVGGAYRHRWRNDADGTEFGETGVHREIVPFKKLVATGQMEGFGGEAVNTMTFVEADGRTTVTVNMLFPTKEIRDGALQSGMSDGMAMGYDRLDEILAEQKVG